MKNDKNAILFKYQEKEMGLKCNENCRKDESINECLALAIRKDELDEFLNKHRNEILHIISFDAKNFLDSRRRGVFVRCVNHPCNLIFGQEMGFARILVTGKKFKRSIEKDE